MPVSALFDRLLVALTICVCCVASSTVYAAKRVELYTASQLVLDESPAIRNKAISLGLSDVFVRVAGNPSVLNNPLIQDALAKSSSYLLQYSYQSTDETITILGDVRPARRLLLQFSSASVQSLFKTAQLPIWPDTRPEVLVWVSGERQGKALLDTQAAEMFALKQAADVRGLPVSAPLLDLTDRQALSATRIWALDEASIRAASTRYDLDAVLAGRLRNTGAGSAPWRGSFILLNKGERQYFKAAAATMEEAARQIIDKATDYLANKQSIVVSDSDFAPSIDILVSNVQGFDAYAGLLTYLKSLPVVASIMVSRVEGSAVKLELGYNGSADKLLSTLSDSEQLQTVPLADSASPAADPSVSAEYLWR